jgi:isoamylase
MLLCGDEVRRSQRGNNNAYCHDDETSWFDWSLVDDHADVLRFTKQLIAFRLNRGLPSERYDATLAELLRDNAVRWHGVRLDEPDWGYHSHTLAATSHLLGGRLLLHLMINAYWAPLEFEVPPLGDAHGAWRRCIDTSLASPDDIQRWCDAPIVRSASYRVAARAIVVLIAGAAGHGNGSRPDRVSDAT